MNDQRQGTSDRKWKRKRRQTEKCAKEKGQDIWFDDVPLECVDGELVASSKKGCVSTSLITGPEKRYMEWWNTDTHIHTHRHTPEAYTVEPL